MRILVVNPNTTSAMTEKDHADLAAALEEDIDRGLGHPGHEPDRDTDVQRDVRTEDR